MDINYWRNQWLERCPICHGPLEEVYFGGGTYRNECSRCVKHFTMEEINE